VLYESIYPSLFGARRDCLVTSPAIPSASLSVIPSPTYRGKESRPFAPISSALRVRK
jgi:hypothetical protein